MNQKLFVLSFFLITILAISGVLIVKNNPSIQKSPLSPTPADDKLEFIKPSPKDTTISQAAQKKPEKQVVAVKQYLRFPGVLSADQLANKKALIETNKGIIEFDIYPEATMAASNFMILASDGFYNGLIFHRVVPGFVIQGGDPLGNGTGGPGYKFPDEPVTKKYLKGTVAMANSGPDTNGSQFFIVLEDQYSLPAQYTIFGKVTKGEDVLGKIKVGDTMNQVIIQSK